MQLEKSKIQHKIILTNPNTVINEKQYPYPQKHLVAWRTLLDQHVDTGQLCRSHSQYASPSLIIPKRDPTALFCWVCDYQTLNSLTVQDCLPLPNVDKLVCLDSLGKIFSILDQTNAFFHTRMREEDIPLTAVKTPWGLYEWRVMPMGLTNAPATHQARLEEALGDVLNDFCVVYLDDIVVFSAMFEDHEQHVRQVLDRPTFIAAQRKHNFSEKTSSSSGIGYLQMASKQTTIKWSRLSTGCPRALRKLSRNFLGQSSG